MTEKEGPRTKDEGTQSFEKKGEKGQKNEGKNYQEQQELIGEEGAINLSFHPYVFPIL